MSCRLDRSDCRRSNGIDCMAGVRAEDLEESGWSVVVLESALHGRKRTVSEQIGARSLSDGAVGVGHHRVFQFDIALEFGSFEACCKNTFNASMKTVGW